MYTQLECKPIGVVQIGLSKKKDDPQPRYQTISRIKIFEEYAAELEGLRDYSHIIVVWWTHEAKRVKSKVKSEWTKGNSRVGIFASRLPVRVNPIGITVVELVRVDVCFVDVRGLDAWTGTPVVDIKPYDFYDMVKSPRVPDWFKKFWAEHKSNGRYSEIVPWLGP